MHILSDSKRNDLEADKSFWNLYQWFSAANVDRQDHNAAWHLALEHFADKSDSKIFWKNFVVSRIDTRGVCVAVSVWPEESLRGSHEGLQQVVDEPKLGVGGGGAPAEGH